MNNTTHQYSLRCAVPEKTKYLWKKLATASPKETISCFLGVATTVDTFFAILRRFLNNVPISQADKHHLHHQLMQMGLTHRQTVLVIYGIALIFSVISLLYPISSLLGSLLLTIATLFGLEIFVEQIGLMGPNRTPLLDFIKKVVLFTEENDQFNKKNKK